MPRIRVRSFQGRIFLAILAVVLVPAVVTAVGGTYTLRGIGTGTGTLGAWDSVAESGRDLLASLDSAGVDDPAIQEAAARHRAALSESVRFSRLYAFVADRLVQVLPLATLVLGLFIAVLAYVTARGLSSGFAGPITELVGWTERIGHMEPLPPANPAEDREVDEFRLLRRSLREMAGEIERGRDQAVEAARLRSWSDFARRVAHEIKNPLTSMRMAAATLASGREGAAGDAGRVLAEDIARLDELARGFSQYGRAPEGPRSDVDVLELMQSLARKEGAGETRVTVSGEGPSIVRAHLDALERAFRNLLINAIEAQVDADAPAVDIQVRPERHGVTVLISDHGPGVPPELLTEIWNPDVTTKRSGTGLGLAIVRKTVEMHGGNVSVRNGEGGGAVFDVWLPGPDAPTPRG